MTWRVFALSHGDPSSPNGECGNKSWRFTEGLFDFPPSTSAQDKIKLIKSWIIFRPYLNLIPFTFEVAALWSSSALATGDRVEMKCDRSPVYTARAPRSSSPGVALHLKWLQRFARKATGFTGLLFRGWGAPTNHNQWPKGGSWMTGTDPQPNNCTDILAAGFVRSCLFTYRSDLSIFSIQQEGNAHVISTKFHCYLVEFVFRYKETFWEVVERRVVGENRVRRKQETVWTNKSSLSWEMWHLVHLNWFIFTLKHTWRNAAVRTVWGCPRGKMFCESEWCSWKK